MSFNTTQNKILLEFVILLDFVGLNRQSGWLNTNSSTIQYQITIIDLLFMDFVENLVGFVVYCNNGI